MADTKTPAKATAPAATKPAAPAAPAPAVGNVEKRKRVKVQYKEVFDTAEAAKAEAESRTKGPRRPFTVTAKTGEVFHVVAHNEGRAGGIAFKQLGGKVEEIGGKAKKAKVLGVDALTAAINALPEDQREQIAKLLAGQK